MNPEEKEARRWAILCHLSGVLPILGPFITWKMKHKEIESITGHGKEVMNFQISIFLFTLLGIPVAMAMTGFILPLLFYFSNLVCLIIAAIKAYEGKSFHYPITIRFIS